MKIKINISKLKRSLRKLPKMLAGKAFLLLLFAILFDILVGAFIFYQYSFLPQREEIQLVEKPLILREGLLSKILKELGERESRLKEASLKVYSDPFQIEEVVELEGSGEPEELTE